MKDLIMQVEERNISRDIGLIKDIIQDMPQAECPVVHVFGDGIYIRQVTMPAGILAVGHVQRFKQNNFLLSGKVAMIGDNGINVLEAPMFFVGEAGQKIGYVIETAVWQNIWATDETDVEKLEATYLNKSADISMDVKNSLERVGRQIDRDDYDSIVDACPFTVEEIKAQVENETDQTNDGWQVTVRDSNIQGQGVFNSYPVEDGECLGPARLDGKRTQLGRYTNHSRTPNATPVMQGDDIYFYAKRFISGCKGGGVGEEITVDYRETLKLSGVELCQQ